jgi:uncharacterized circularly permuted ATP-grasp superfamily protein
MLEQIIEDYHDLLTPAVAQETWDRLVEGMQTHRIGFGDRLLCTVLRPRFLTREQYEEIERECGLLLRAFATAYDALMREPRLRAQLDLTSAEEELIAMDPGFEPPTVSSRLDCFITPEGGFSSVEYNAETPAGIAYSDALSRLFLELPVMEDFQRRYRVQAFNIRPYQLEAMLAAWRAWGGQGKPRIGIIDWVGVPTTNEFLLFQDYFAENGLDTIIASPEELEYSGGKLRARGQAIDFLYKRVLASELLDKYGLDQPVVRAIRDHAVCMGNSFRAKVLHKKSIHAFLTDERNAGLFDREEREAIAQHIPWTRKVEERKTQHAGQWIDLVPFVAGNRERLVLKPNDEYGGKGVVIGWETDDTAWARAVQDALNEPTVAQERVEVATEDYAALVNGTVEVSPRLVDLDPYFFSGKTVYGMLTRLSTVALLNVTAGGGSVVPAFVVE